MSKLTLVINYPNDDAPPVSKYMLGGEVERAAFKDVTVNEWQEEVIAAARAWVNCKGRYHSELNMQALIHLFKEEPKND